MVKALRQWLDTHELPAIIAAVVGVVVALSVLMVVGGYLAVAPRANFMRRPPLHFAVPAAA